MIPLAELKVFGFDKERGVDLRLVASMVHKTNYETAIINSASVMKTLKLSSYIEEHQELSAFDVSIGISLAFGYTKEKVVEDLANAMQKIEVHLTYEE